MIIDPRVNLLQRISGNRLFFRKFFSFDLKSSGSSLSLSDEVLNIALKKEDVIFSVGQTTNTKISVFVGNGASQKIAVIWPLFFPASHEARVKVLAFFANVDIIFTAHRLTISIQFTREKTASSVIIFSSKLNHHVSNLRLKKHMHFGSPQLSVKLLMHLFIMLF